MPAPSAIRHVTIFFTDIVGFTELTDRLGDRAASELINDVHQIAAGIVERDGRGRIIKFIGDSIFAVMDSPSQAISRALEIQRRLSEWRSAETAHAGVHLRMGLHVGEVLLEREEQLDIVGRHVNHARRVMEAAEGDQLLATRVVVDAGKDFIEGVAPEDLVIRYYGEYYLKGVGATELCEIADRHIRTPRPPAPIEGNRHDALTLSRLKLSGYETAERLGEGAFGVVYRATEAATGRQVAVKVLAPVLAGRRDCHQRFVNEIDRLSRLDAPGIVRVVHAELDHTPPFFAMEYVEGVTLEKRIDGAKSLEIAALFASVASVLERAHMQGVVHGDLKPRNVLVRPDGDPVIVDFGLSHLLDHARDDAPDRSRISTTDLLGTPHYAAPELLRNGERSIQSDVYALGVMLFEALAGQLPFSGRSVHEIIEGHYYHDPPLPTLLNSEVPESLQRICLKAIEKKPADRYASMEAIAADLRRVCEGEPVRVRPTYYDNLIFHRARRHVSELETWKQQGLINHEEHQRLLSQYEMMLRRGVAAVMEGRRLRIGQVMVYVGGWVVANAAAIWLTAHWDRLSTLARLLLGSIPALAAIIMAVLMLRREHFRLGFVALVMAVLAFPLVVGVWVYEFGILDTRLSVPDDRMDVLELTTWMFGEERGASNWQLLVIMLSTAVIAGCVMTATRTVTHSAQAALAAIGVYGCILLVRGELPLIMNLEWALFALRLLPLLALTIGISFWLVRDKQRHPQALPWMYASAALLVFIVINLTRDGVDQWLGSRITDYRGLEASIELGTTVGGIALLVVGTWARKFLKHRGRIPTFGVTLAGQMAVIYGLLQASSSWPRDWWKIALLGSRGDPVPVSLLVLLFVGVAFAVTACITQMKSFLFTGLSGMALALYWLGHEHFAQTMLWPTVLMTAGVLCFLIALRFELRRRKDYGIDDIDTNVRR